MASSSATNHFHLFDSVSDFDSGDISCGNSGFSYFDQNRAAVGLDVANKPFDEVWQKASVALQQAQGQDLEQKQSARTM
jgi:hypothetical protein